MIVFLLSITALIGSMTSVGEAGFCCKSLRSLISMVAKSSLLLLFIILLLLLFAKFEPRLLFVIVFLSFPLLLFI